MIRPEEVAGLTAALAKSVDQRVADLVALMDDATYRAALDSHGGWNAAKAKAHRALQYLMEAERQLRELADVLGKPAKGGV